MTQIKCIFNERHRLAEGPLWDSDAQRLLWVDIENQKLHSARADGGDHDEKTIPGGITSISLTDSGHYIGTGEKTFLLLSRTFSEIWRSAIVEFGSPDNRFNDAKVDPGGRLWAGTMNRKLREPSGHLYCLNRRLEWTRRDSGYIVSNGPTFALDGKTLWQTDSVRRVIYRFRLSPRGLISDRQEFIRFTDAEGHPDGMTTDREGCLWVAGFAGACVIRFSPQGERLLRIDLPASNVTSCAFGGADYRSLFVTTAAIGLTEERKAAEPLAGGIFRIDGVGAGIPPHRFRIDRKTLAGLGDGEP
jgi:sugar lactone lactonase YvrE